MRLSEHARLEIAKRRIPEYMVEELLDAPQQVVPGYNGRVVHQSQFNFGTGERRLVRAIIEPWTTPPTVVTVYHTSKIRKYWRTP